MSLRAVAVLPARFASSRLPGKPLLADTGRPLIRHVWEQVSRAQRLERVIVATDDIRIHDAVVAFGGEAAMTSENHRSGSDRVAEVGRGLPGIDVLLNVQGDEPEVDPADLDRLIARLEAGDEDLATLARPFRAEEQAAYLDQNNVKVVPGGTTPESLRALYFSRAPIPHGSEPLGAHLHIGVYGWRRDALERFTATAPTALEGRERLEQLRALELGLSIAVVLTDHDALGIDTPDDYARFVERIRAESES